MKPVFARGLPLLLVYVVIAGWLAWPLPAYMTTSLPCTTFVCTYDTIYTAWVLAYETHALTTAPAQLYEANIYHPEHSALLYGPTSLGALPFFAPTFLATGNPALSPWTMLPDQRREQQRAAAPPSSVMNARRFIRSPRRPARAA